MIRILYRLLLALHPPAFRRQFAGEMLWIFDETRGTAAAGMLMSDAMISLARQWLLRSGAWKLALAGAGAVIQITLGGLGLGLFRQLHVVSRSHWVSATDRPDMMQLIYLTVGVVGGVICSVLALALWVKTFTARRLRSS
jgi:hypothetical protein